MCCYQCCNGHFVPGYANTLVCPKCGERLNRVEKKKPTRKWRGSRKNDDRIKKR
jgi:transcription initiation factor IIE alpha subunit